MEVFKNKKGPQLRADDLSKLLVNELFENIDNIHDFENFKYPELKINFWLDED